MSKKRPFFENQLRGSPDSETHHASLEARDALKFHQSLPGYRPTPVVSLPQLAQHLHVGSIYVKDESARLGLNAFKVLGASYAIHRTLEKNPGIETFCTATDGNHGKAVAWAASRLGRQSVVFVPWDTTAQRIAAIEAQGARVLKLLATTMQLV
ncbi:MAG: pyridoxal-phosphate dependent enzyme [Bacteroidota bacterium]